MAELRDGTHAKHLDNAASIATDEPTPGRPGIHEIRARTVLNRVRPPMPFRWSANPYRGCQHA